jgi:hypothetical protein
VPSICRDCVLQREPWIEEISSGVSGCAIRRSICGAKACVEQRLLDLAMPKCSLVVVNFIEHGADPLWRNLTVLVLRSFVASRCSAGRSDCLVYVKGRF